MKKTAEQMTKDILSALRKDDAPEAVLLEIYLEKYLNMAKKEGLKDVLGFIEKHDVDIDGNIVNCNYHMLFDLLKK
jgi:hypothetical protein